MESSLQKAPEHAGPHAGLKMCAQMLCKGDKERLDLGWSLRWILPLFLCVHPVGCSWASRSNVLFSHYPFFGFWFIDSGLMTTIFCSPTHATFSVFLPLFPATPPPPQVGLLTHCPLGQQPGPLPHLCSWLHSSSGQSIPLHS